MRGTGGGGPPAAAPADEENRQLALTRITTCAAEHALLAATLAGVRVFFAADADE